MQIISEGICPEKKTENHTRMQEIRHPVTYTIGVRCTMNRIKIAILAVCILGVVQLLMTGVTAADYNAYLQLQGSEGIHTNNDTVPAGSYLLQYTNTISAMPWQESRVFGNISYSLGFDNIAHVITIGDSDWAVKNSTAITWVYPENVTIQGTDFHLVSTATDYYSPGYIPLSISRSMNNTRFSGGGYQKVNFTVSFENINTVSEDRICDSVWTGINAKENELLNATLLLDTFSTDAPTGYYNPDRNTIHELSFTWDKSKIELNRVYNFSIVINVVPKGSTTVIYKPYFSVILFNITTNTTVESGKFTTMPRDMLPPHVTHAFVSQNQSLNWIHALDYGKGAWLNQIRVNAPSTDIGVFRSGQWILDYGMDGTVNRRFNYGMATDKPIRGDFNNDGTTDIGVFRAGQWILDYGMDGTVNRRFNYGLATDIPVVGDFNKDGTMDIGVFRSGQWILDYGMDGTVNRRFNYGLATDIPVVGDFNKDGTTDIGVFRTGQWILDYGMDGSVNRRFNYGMTTDIPVVGDFNNDGTTDIGVFRAGQWILDYGMDGTVNRRFNYGLATDIPVVGKWG